MQLTYFYGSENYVIIWKNNVMVIIKSHHNFDKWKFIHHSKQKN